MANVGCSAAARRQYGARSEKTGNKRGAASSVYAPLPATPPPPPPPALLAHTLCTPFPISLRHYLQVSQLVEALKVLAFLKLMSFIQRTMKIGTDSAKARAFSLFILETVS